MSEFMESEKKSVETSASLETVRSDQTPDEGHVEGERSDLILESSPLNSSRTPQTTISTLPKDSTRHPSATTLNEAEGEARPLSQFIMGDFYPTTPEEEEGGLEAIFQSDKNGSRIITPDSSSIGVS